MVAENAFNPLKLQDSLLPDLLNLKSSNGLDAGSYRSTSSFQAENPLEALNLSASSSVQASSQLPFTSGVFTVGSGGQVGIDYLFDGGGYQGELAIFSLQGLASLRLGTPECTCLFSLTPQPDEEDVVEYDISNCKSWIQCSHAH